MNITLHRDLSHLTAEQCEELYLRYRNETLTLENLTKEYNLDFLKVDMFPSDTLEERCRHCKSILQAPKLSRLKPLNSARKAVCTACRHRQLVENEDDKEEYPPLLCACVGCKKEKAEHKKLAIKAERQAYENKLQLVKKLAEENRGKGVFRLPFTENVGEFRLSDVVGIMALIEAMWEKSKKGSQEYISPIFMGRGRANIYPSIEYLANSREDIVLGAFERGLLQIDIDNSDINKIVLNENNTNFSFSSDIVAYKHRFVDENQERLSIKEVYQTLYHKLSNNYWYRNWNDEFLDVWENLAVNECIEFARYKAHEFSFGFNNVEKIAEISRNLLKTFSVSECFYFIGVAYYGASEFFTSNESNGRRHAENTVIGKIISMSKSGKRESWARPYGLERSSFSIFLFDIMLRTRNDAGFRLCIYEDYKNLINYEKVMWPIVLNNSIAISEVDGLNEFGKLIAGKEFTPSTDDICGQLITLGAIATKIGLIEAANFCDAAAILSAEEDPDESEIEP